MLECLINGELSRLVPASDRGLNYGDGLFETIAVLRGRPRWWQAHMDRLRSGCKALALPMTDQVILLREVQTVSAGQERCVVKILISRGSGGRGYSSPDQTHALRVVSAHAWPETAVTEAGQGVRARSCQLRLASQPALGGIKHLNRLEQVMASRELQDLGVDTGILFDQDDHLISAISANIFLVSDNRLLTPRLDRCGVRGVMRHAILQAFSGRCEQRRIHRDMLQDADEVLLTNAVRGIVPVTAIDDLVFSVGPVCVELQAWLASAGQT